ncbi:terminase large subunit [Hymenobacter sp. BT594]|uniref:Terminase large subunit n=2 Tax=Hymenobacter guriensis TaxID=2793065 RepID=A0ABS0KYY0_9BACT|nr:terminase large subunit [Hymenobacter guriensis]
MKPLQDEKRRLLAEQERDDFALAEIEKQLAPYRKLLRKMPARACKWVVLSCQRQLDDLQRKRFKYHFDEARASRICRFLELLPHTKGEWAKQKLLITLEPWQIFILCVTFGWVDDLGRRRYKVSYKEIPRKNAKSTLSSGVGLYMLTADGEGGPEVYSAATTKDQAKIVWRDAWKMAQKSEGLQRKFGVKTAAHSIYTEDGGSFLALARDQGGNLDGLNTHCGIIDELHAHKTREVVDVIETSTGARSQPMLWQITTAGFNLSGICYETRTYTQKVLSGVIKDEEHFGIIFTIDEDDDWADPSSWAKANPNWGISVNVEDVTRKGNKAVKVPAARGNFQTKHLNVWVNAAQAWMDMRAWNAGADESLSLEQFAGESCWAAVDLATKTDVAALALLFHREGIFYLFWRFYVPQAMVEGEENAHYAGWADEGMLVVTPGNVIDQNAIQDDVRGLAATHELKVMGYDPWQANKFAAELAEEGLPVSEYRMTVQNMSEPMKELHAWVVSGKLRHNGDPVMTWMMSNVVAHQDAKENIFPRKENPKSKIDGPVAAIMAVGEYMTGAEDESSVYEDRGLILL